MKKFFQNADKGIIATVEFGILLAINVIINLIVYNVAQNVFPFSLNIFSILFCVFLSIMEVKWFVFCNEFIYPNMSEESQKKERNGAKCWVLIQAGCLLVNYFTQVESSTVHVFLLIVIGSTLSLLFACSSYYLGKQSNEDEDQVHKEKSDETYPDKTRDSELGEKIVVPVLTPKSIKENDKITINVVAVVAIVTMLTIFITVTFVFLKKKTLM